ncbi:MAG: hypothetical protein FJ320_04420 [SAR202 cluster bacterium]|nr:hypothetical protein [SAR202 cluster bacterium]
MFSWNRPALAAVLLALLVLALNLAVVQAHERRNVGPYKFVVGWDAEPAYEGQRNGVGVRITASNTTQPVEGAQETLQVEVTHVPSGARQTSLMRAVFRDPGHYTVDILPTAPGQYRFRFFGTVGGTTVNETFESGPNTFDDMEAIDAIQFPEKLASLRQIEGAARGAQTAASEADDKASSAQVLAVAGIALGVIGLIAGGAGLWLALRRK